MLCIKSILKQWKGVDMEDDDWDFWLHFIALIFGYVLFIVVVLIFS